MDLLDILGQGPGGRRRRVSSMPLLDSLSQGPPTYLGQQREDDERRRMEERARRIAAQEAFDEQNQAANRALRGSTASDQFVSNITGQAGRSGMDPARLAEMSGEPGFGGAIRMQQNSFKNRLATALQQGDAAQQMAVNPQADRFTRLLTGASGVRDSIDAQKMADAARQRKSGVYTGEDGSFSPSMVNPPKMVTTAGGDLIANKGRGVLVDNRTQATKAIQAARRAAAPSSEERRGDVLLRTILQGRGTQATRDMAIAKGLLPKDYGATQAIELEKAKNPQQGINPNQQLSNEMNVMKLLMQSDLTPEQQNAAFQDQFGKPMPGFRPVKTGGVVTKASRDDAITGLGQTTRPDVTVKLSKPTNVAQWLDSVGQAQSDPRAMTPEAMPHITTIAGGLTPEVIAPILKPTYGHDSLTKKGFEKARKRSALLRKLLGMPEQTFEPNLNASDLLMPSGISDAF